MTAASVEITVKESGPLVVTWPVQCRCGRVFLERYQFTTPNNAGMIGFCWCGWCRRRLFVKTTEPAIVQ
jgi:hypothetical protein